MTVDKHLRKHLKARAKFGSNKYGKELLPFNGRNPLRDKREELLDALVYNEQDIMERERLAREIEDAYNFLYNFRQADEIENASLDRAIASLGEIVVKLEADTERIEPEEEWKSPPIRHLASVDISDLWNRDSFTKDAIAIPPVVMRNQAAKVESFSETFGPDAPPVEPNREYLRESHEVIPPKQTYSFVKYVPLGPVMESIRKDGPIGHRDLLEIAEKHPAMERLEQMECSCCGKCVQ